jgi:hypothetical protein
MLLAFSSVFFLVLRTNHRMFACVKAISWAPTDCDTQTEEVETTLVSFSSYSFIEKMVRRLRSRILIDYTGMCKKREESLETTHDIAHPILVVAITSIASSTTSNTNEENKDMFYSCTFNKQKKTKISIDYSMFR